MSASEICNMPEGRFRSALKRGVVRLFDMVGLRAQDKRVNNSAARLDALYGPPWPEKLSPLPQEWFDGLPRWAFQTRRGRARPRQQCVEELNLIHAERMKNYEKRREDNRLVRDTIKQGRRGDG